LLKLYARSFTDDFILAAIAPKLRYDPNNGSPHSFRNEPAVYVRQALVLGDLESIADALLIQERENPPRAMSFSDFDQIVGAEGKASESVQAFFALFVGFSPETRPILARVLVAQACMSELILSTYSQKTRNSQLEDRLGKIISSLENSKALSWGQDQHSEDLVVAHNYWTERLRWLASSGSSIETDKLA